MDLFDGLLSGIAGANFTAVVGRLIDKHGGVQGIVSLLQDQGLRETVNSWVQVGPNLPISAVQVSQIFGPDVMRDVASRIGMDPQNAAAKIAQFLPVAIDKLTPGGVIPGTGGK